MCVPQAAADEVSGATEEVPPPPPPRLLLATSVTAHLTHLARPAIGTKMFSSHGNNVVQASHEWGRGRGYRGVAAKNKNWYKFFTHTFHAFHTPLAGWQQIEMFISKCLLRIYEQSPLCQVRPPPPFPPPPQVVCRPSDQLSTIVINLS